LPRREVDEEKLEPQGSAPIIGPVTALSKVLVICDSHEDTDRSRGPSVLHHILIGSLRASGAVEEPRVLERELMLEIGVSARLQDYADIINRSRMTINFSQTLHGDRHLKGGVFEATTEAALLFEEEGPETRRLFKPGRDYLEFHSSADLLEQIVHFHRNPDQLAKIAGSGHERSRRVFSAPNLWTHVLHTLGVISQDALTPDYQQYRATVDVLQAAP